MQVYKPSVGCHHGDIKPSSQPAIRKNFFNRCLILAFHLHLFNALEGCRLAVETFGPAPANSTDLVKIHDGIQYMRNPYSFCTPDTSRLGFLNESKTDDRLHGHCTSDLPHNFYTSTNTNKFVSYTFLHLCVACDQYIKPARDTSQNHVPHKYNPYSWRPKLVNCKSHALITHTSRASDLRFPTL